MMRVDLVDIINNYLADNRRLIVPAFGAFIVKGEDDIIFSELLTSDDGVLRGLLIARGLSEIEAAANINRFAYEVRHGLDSQGIYPIAEFGTFTYGEHGVIQFDHTKPQVVIIPQPAARPVQPIQPKAPAVATPAATPIAPAAKSTPQPRPRHAGGNWVIWVAVVVIVLALFALGYGLYCMSTSPSDDDLDARMDEHRIPRMEIPQSPKN